MQHKVYYFISSTRPVCLPPCRYWSEHTYLHNFKVITLSQLIVELMCVHCLSLDVDECEDGSAKCSNGCRNTFGSYRCFCPHGFHLDADDATCIGKMHAVLCGLSTVFSDTVTFVRVSIYSFQECAGINILVFFLNSLPTNGAYMSHELP